MIRVFEVRSRRGLCIVGYVIVGRVLWGMLFVAPCVMRACGVPCIICVCVCMRVFVNACVRVCTNTLYLTSKIYRERHRFTRGSGALVRPATAIRNQRLSFMQLILNHHEALRLCVCVCVYVCACTCMHNHSYMHTLVHTYTIHTYMCVHT
jgi:hypothetical protein